MIDASLKSRVNTLKNMIDEATGLVAFTGAGISAESGIPTYRGDDGLWNKYDPDKFANIDYFYKNPYYYWTFFKDIRYPLISKAAPNAGHLALTRLEVAKKLSTVITQNIDGLHQEAGSINVLELHGNTRRIICLQCNAVYDFDSVYALLDHQLPPQCQACGGMLKPDVVFFGESLSMQVLEAAIDAAQSCDLFLVVGSSLVVHPAASLPMAAKKNGARLVIINKDPTPLDHLADLVLHGAASSVLSGA